MQLSLDVGFVDVIVVMADGGVSRVQQVPQRQAFSCFLQMDARTKSSVKREEWKR